jgi:hypothetical protein
MTRPRHNPENERAKRLYRSYLQVGRGCSEASLDKSDAAIAAFEASIGYRSLKSEKNSSRIQGLLPLAG